jgi:hypothetical protein
MDRLPNDMLLMTMRAAIDWGGAPGLIAELNRKGKVVMKIKCLNTANGHLGYVSTEHSQSSYGMPIFYDLENYAQLGGLEVGPLAALEYITPEDQDDIRKVFELLPILPPDEYGRKQSDEEFEEL